MTQVKWHNSLVARSERATITGGQGATVWLTGLPAAGKSTLGVAVEQALIAQGRAAYFLDGDNLRHGLNVGLGFSPDERDENVRRAGEVALLMADAGLIAVVALVSPYRAARDRIRERHSEAGLSFVEVHLSTPLSICEQRDPKGLYAKARAGELEHLTGVDDPYEPPLQPEVTIPVDLDPREATATVIATLERLEMENIGHSRDERLNGVPTRPIRRQANG